MLIRTLRLPFRTGKVARTCSPPLAIAPSCPFPPPPGPGPDQAGDLEAARDLIREDGRELINDVRDLLKGASQRIIASPADDLAQLARLKEQQRVRDRVLRVALPAVRLALLVHTHTAQTAVAQHRLTRTTGTLLARALAGAALLAAQKKGEERVTVSLQGAGPVPLVLAEAVRTGEARGYVHGGDTELPPGTPLGLALGAGTLEVSEVLYGARTPYRSVVALAQGDVLSDLREYFARVEQIPSHLSLDTAFHGEQLVWSGGLLVQALPPPSGLAPDQALSYGEAAVETVRRRLARLPPLQELILGEGRSLEQVAALVADEPELPPERLESHALAFYCRCSRKGVLAHLALLPVADLAEFEAAPSPIACQYCAKQYALTSEEIRALRLQRAQPQPRQ